MTDGATMSPNTTIRSILFFYILLFINSGLLIKTAASDSNPGINLLSVGCSQYKVDNFRLFRLNLLSAQSSLGWRQQPRRRSVSELREDQVDECLLKRAWKLYESGMHKELVDETIQLDEYTEKEAKKVVEIALMCIQPSPAMRPTMSEVVALLKSQGSIQLNQPLAKPAFLDSDPKSLPDTPASSISRVPGR